MLVRFGRWDDLIAEPLPDDPALYCSTAATIHYGRGVAHAAKGQLSQAHAEREAFATAYACIPETRYLFNNTVLDILAVAAEMLDGEIAYRESRFDEGFAHLRRAIELDDSLPYDEPWGWMQPTTIPNWPARVSIRATCGACTAITNACNASGALPRRRSSANNST